jgi:CheY-like chemotaxis protein
MTTKVNCIMLVDDNKDDNFFHERVIKKNNSADVVVIKQSGLAALDYLKNKINNDSPHPDLIFLDINMPGLNGWEFLGEYDKLERELQSKIVIVMLTTSENPDDKDKALALKVLADFRIKPITRNMLNEIIGQYF